MLQLFDLLTLLPDLKLLAREHCLKTLVFFLSLSNDVLRLVEFIRKFLRGSLVIDVFGLHLMCDQLLFVLEMLHLGLRERFTRV